MNRISQYREAFRKARRQEQLSLFKQNVRNLIYYQQPAQATAGQCSLCFDDRWLYAEQVRHVVRLLIAVFHESHVCDAHIEAFLSKTLECLQVEPGIYERLMCGTGRQRRELVYRKILLLLEVFDNPLLLENEGIWREIERSFEERGLMGKVMDCAYSFGEWEAEEEDENWEAEVKGICYTSVLNIFGKFPLLFHSYLEDYPISILLDKARGRKRVEVLGLLKAIVGFSEEKVGLKGTVVLLFVGFKSHLSDIQHLQQSLQVFVGEVELFNAFEREWALVDWECVCSLLCLIRVNHALHAHAYQLIFASLQNIQQSNLHIELSDQLEIASLMNRMTELSMGRRGRMVDPNTEMETQ